MRLYVLHDQDGRILAASQVDDGGDETLTLRPVPADASQAVDEVDVPPELAERDLADLCENMRVDPGQRRLVSWESAG